ncbi:hypothetical protein [Ferrimicrobium acidiphilum]|uniref:hypothetical protein n=1 Tax=Ferrimicrobium acidiphilum TaxID=121039 RepID=UPI0023F05E1C|nr:hypothetical protein [Ferrimicrobium acidiphilum]
MNRATHCFVVMAELQEISDRETVATGKGIGELAVKRFRRTGKWVFGTLLIILSNQH